MDKTIKVETVSDALPHIFDNDKLPQNMKAFEKMLDVMQEMTGKVTFKRPEGK